MGQTNERPILVNFLKESKKGNTLYTVENLYCPGLVKKGDAPYCKTTVDAFGPAKMNSDETELVGVEVKTRVTHRTRQQEILRRNRRNNYNGEIFTEVDASS